MRYEGSNGDLWHRISKNETENLIKNPTASHEHDTEQVLSQTSQQILTSDFKGDLFSKSQEALRFFIQIY